MTAAAATVTMTAPRRYSPHVFWTHEDSECDFVKSARSFLNGRFDAAIDEAITADNVQITDVSTHTMRALSRARHQHNAHIANDDDGGIGGDDVKMSTLIYNKHASAFSVPEEYRVSIEEFSDAVVDQMTIACVPSLPKILGDGRVLTDDFTSKSNDRAVASAHVEAQQPKSLDARPYKHVDRAHRGEEPVERYGLIDFYDYRPLAADLECASATGDGTRKEFVSSESGVSQPVHHRHVQAYAPVNPYESYESNGVDDVIVVEGSLGVHVLDEGQIERFCDVDSVRPYEMAESAFMDAPDWFWGDMEKRFGFDTNDVQDERWLFNMASHSKSYTCREDDGTARRRPRAFVALRKMEDHTNTARSDAIEFKHTGDGASATRCPTDDAQEEPIVVDGDTNECMFISLLSFLKCTQAHKSQRERRQCRRCARIVDAVCWAGAAPLLKEAPNDADCLRSACSKFLQDYNSPSYEEARRPLIYSHDAELNSSDGLVDCTQQQIRHYAVANVISGDTQMPFSCAACISAIVEQRMFPYVVKLMQLLPDRFVRLAASATSHITSVNIRPVTMAASPLTIVDEDDENASCACMFMKGVAAYRKRDVQRLCSIVRISHGELNRSQVRRIIYVARKNARHYTHSVSPQKEAMRLHKSNKSSTNARECQVCAHHKSLVSLALTSLYIMTRSI